MKISKLSILLIGGVLLAVALYSSVLLFLTWPITELTIDRSGIFGDSFGPLTSLFSGLAFAGLIITIVMQKDELALQREELTLTRYELAEQKDELKAQNETLVVQRFENTFFKMLEFLEACRNDLYYKGFQSNPAQGRDAIKKMYEVFVGGHLHIYVSDGFDQKKVFDKQCEDIDGIIAVYNSFYEREFGEELGQYYRTLYHILKLVDKSEYIKDKKTYTSLVRAQLSRYELSLLFYNCLSDFGKVKMAPLVKRYSMLKHLEESCLPEQHVSIWKEFNA